MKTPNLLSSSSVIASPLTLHGGDGLAAFSLAVLWRLPWRIETGLKWQRPGPASMTVMLLLPLVLL
jgi:hypothetical protein